MARTVKCPSCGAELTVKDDKRDFMFCEYCGTKVRLDDYQETHRFVDEARIRESENEKELELKRMEFEEKKRKDNDKGFWIMIVGFLVFMIAMGVLGYLGEKGIL